MPGARAPVVNPALPWSSDLAENFPLIHFYICVFQDLLDRVEAFQQQSQKLLSEEMPSAAELQELLDVSFDFDVELPQLPELRARLEQARWLEDVQLGCSEHSSLTLDAMRRLIDSGVGLAPYPAVEKAMAKLQELLTVSEHWDDKARNLIKAR